MTHLRIVGLDELPLPITAGEYAPEVLEAAQEAARELAASLRARRSLPGDGDRKKRRKPNARLRLHAELQDRIVTMIRGGNYPTTAAVASGIPAGTWRTWMGKGREAIALRESGSKLMGNDELYATLVTEVEAAWHEAEAAIVEVVQRIATGEVVSSVVETYDDEGEVIRARTIHFMPPHPTTTRWMLEKMAPDRWGRNRIEVTGAEGGPIPVEVAISARESLRAKLGLAAERMGLAEPEDEG